MKPQKTTVIHQPDFFPYLGFFHRFLHADLYIVLDHVQFSRNWGHRDKIKTESGASWLTLNVEKKTPLKTPIHQVRIGNGFSARKHLDMLEGNYRDARFFEEVMPHIEAIYKEPASLLMEFNMRALTAINDLLDISIPMVFSSDLEPQGKQTEMLIDLLKKTETTCYLSGLGARDYLSDEPFKAAKIDLKWQRFEHPTYTQVHGEFIPYLSILDVLLNCGIEKTKQILRTL